MRIFKSCILLALIVTNSYSLDLKDIGKSVVDATKGIANKIPDVIPSPEEFFQSAKNAIAGYPFDIAFRAINQFCSAALSTNAVKPRSSPDITNMSLVLKYNEQNLSVPLHKPEALWKLKEFNSNLPLVIMVTGWTTNFNDTENPTLDKIYAAYRCRGGVNFVTVDTSSYVDTLYSWSAFNTEEIGNLIANALQHLIKTYPIENIHLIGHSLGAHIVGSAGRNLNYKTDKLLPRITGLDPANPCFNSGENLTGISRGDAEFVDIIHSNPGALGKRDALGDADFYPNGLDPLPPGCVSISCAHARAPEFYAESVYPGYENNFLGVKCGSLTALKGNFCPGKKFAMGYATPKNLKGNYFLKTTDKSLYGENAPNNFTVICKNGIKLDEFLNSTKNESINKTTANNTNNTQQTLPKDQDNQHRINSTNISNSSKNSTNENIELSSSMLLIKYPKENKYKQTKP